MHSFSSANFNVPGNTWYWRKYIDYFELGKKRNALTFYVVDFLRGIFVPFIGRRDFVLRYFGKKQDEHEVFNGFIPMKDALLLADELLENAKQRAEHFFNKTEVINSTLVFYLDKIIELSKEYDIDVVLVRFPVTENYHDEVLQYLDEKMIVNIDEIVRKVIEDNQNVIYLDSHDLYFGQKSVFKDADHLNVKGAKLYSKYIKQQIKIGSMSLI